MKKKGYEEYKKEYIRKNKEYINNEKSNFKTFGRMFILIFLLIMIPIQTYVLLKDKSDIFGSIDKSNNIIAFKLSNGNNLEKKVEELVKKNNSNEEKYTTETYKINADFYNVFLKIGETKSKYYSYLLTNKNAKEIDVLNILKKDSKDKFLNIIKENIEIKYPKFIADELKDSTFIYNFKENKVYVYFEDYEINPNPNKDLFVIINYNDIKELLNFEVQLDNEYINENVVAIDPAKPTVAFTYDDGPSGKTKDIVDILKENKSNATFFELGKNMANYPDITRYALNYGNEIASHTYNHKYLTKSQDDTITWEVNATNDLFRTITGKELTMLRPPYGSYNQKTLDLANMPFIMWSIDTRDWESRNTDSIVSNIINNIKDGDIILMHDLYQTTVEATRVVLPELYIRGYQIVTVSKLSELKGKPLEPGKSYRAIR